MSLVVVVNGQYKNYELSDYHTDYRVRSLRHTKEVTPKQRFDKEGFPKNETDQDIVAPDRKAKIEKYDKIAHPHERRRVVFARDIMSSPVHGVNEEDNLSVVIQEFDKFGFRHLPVFKGDQMTGMITERDVLKFSQQANFQQLFVKNVMTHEALLAKENSEISLIARVMLEQKIGSLPIIDENQRIVGIITTSDLLKVLMSSFPLNTYS